MGSLGKNTRERDENGVSHGVQVLVLRRSVVFFSTGFVYSAHLCSWRRVCCDFGLFQLHWNCRQARLHCCWVLCSMVLPFLFFLPITYLVPEKTRFSFLVSNQKRKIFPVNLSTGFFFLDDLRSKCWISNFLLLLFLSPCFLGNQTELMCFVWMSPCFCKEFCGVCCFSLSSSISL